MTKSDARKIGIRACMEKIGYDFCVKHNASSTTAYGETDGKMYCFVGVNDKPVPVGKDDALILSDVKGFPYCASCNVDMNNGNIEFLKCELPDMIT